MIVLLVTLSFSVASHNIISSHPVFFRIMPLSDSITNLSHRRPFNRIFSSLQGKNLWKIKSWHCNLGTITLYRHNIKITFCTDIIQIYSQRHVTSFQPMIALDSCMRWDNEWYYVCIFYICQASDNISQNTLLEYVLIHSVFESLIQVCTF